MAERKANINVGLTGMNRTSFNHQIDEKIYTFQLNGNTETDEQGGVALTNEHSNLLCSKFKPGYFVIGNKFDINSNRVYFFLVNPTTGLSEIGYIKYYHDLQNLEDTLQECNCSYEAILSEPLENQEQIEGCVYTTLISDCEDNLCLNFSRLHPIKDIEIKGEKYFKSIYWSDGFNPPRYLQLNNLEQYLYRGTEVCGEVICDEDITGKTTADRVEDCTTCLDCEKLRMFKRYSIPSITPTTIQFGGNLRMGSYEFLIAYSDRLGNELSEYFSITNPIHIFDKNNYILTQPELADRTNFSIALTVDNLDRDFQFYKVVVIQRTDINGETSQFVEGIHPISDTTVLYTTEVDKQRITLQEIFAQKPIFKTWKGLTASNNYLFGYGYTTEKEWNLQPVVNLMGGLVKWQTYQAKQSLYEDGVASSKFKGYMRDEVYPFGIRFGTKDGYMTAIFPLINRPASDEESEEIVFEVNGVITTSDKNAASILENSPECASTGRTKLWQYYNTAEFEGFCTSYNLEDFDTVVRTTTEICKVRVCDENGENCTDIIDTIPSGALTLPINTSNFKGLKNWFKTNKDLIYKCCTGNDPCSGIEVEGECPDPNSPCIGSEWGSLFPPEICNLATNTYEDFSCTPSIPFDTCEECEDGGDLEANQCLPPVLAECSEEVPYPNDVYIKQVSNEKFFLIEKEWEDEYAKTNPFGDCTIFIEGTGDGFRLGKLVEVEWDSDGLDPSLLVTIYKRTEELMYNNTCNNAAEVFKAEYTPFSYFFPHTFVTNKTDVEADGFLTTPIQAYVFGNIDTSFSYTYPGALSVPLTIVFPDKITKKPLWFKIKREDLEFQNEGEEPSIIFEITKQAEYQHEDERTAFDGGGLFESSDMSWKKFRYHILSECPSETLDPDILLEGGYLNLEDGYWRMFKESEFDAMNTDVFYIVLDAPIVKVPLMPGMPSHLHTTVVNNGCFNVIKRAKEYKCAEITFDRIEISKKQTYEATCKYIVPYLNDCEPTPFSYGKFAYTESTENYPDNKDLYDSSKLLINSDDIPEYIREDFENYYVGGSTSEGNYYLDIDKTDFRCKPIRHFKFPDNKVDNASFIFNQQTADANDTIIYPIGITVDDKVINSFLDIAVKNGLITESQRNSITNYEISRGDRTIHKSVLYKGIANDMYRYYDRGQEKWFRNFPFNSLGENQFVYENNFRSNFIQHPYDNEGNNKFSIIAPEVYYDQPSTGTEISIEGYEMGYADGLFREVEGHSKWVILGDKAKDLASTLATLEVTFESAMNIGESYIGMATSMWSGWTAFSWGFGFSIAGNVIVTVANVVSSILFKYARYKYEWLEIFKNNGTPYNFAHRFVGTGNYNFFLKNTDEDSTLRGIVVGKYLRPGNAVINDEKGKSIIRVNNIDRESSYFVSFGQEYPIEYIPSYANWDNTDESFSSSSRYLSSDAGCDGSTSTRRVGSPYMSIKVYNPSQYGTIDSIKWIPVKHDSVLNKNPEEENNCKAIFGGDVYITRVALKNKYRFFLVDAMKIADRIPFDYHLYSNIGSSRFYASYETPITQIESGRPMPFADSTYVLNCPDEEVTYTNDFYLKPTANRSLKFYLHSFGVPYFFVESTINNEYRYGGVEPHEQFYPNVDPIEWTEEEKNSFFHNNTFFYNNTYSKNTTPNGARTLPSFYDKEEWDGLFEYSNGVVWSQQDNSEQDLRDPWLVYKPLDKYQFPTDYGKLISLKGIESYQVLGRFENNALIFNAVDNLADRLTESNWVLGTGGIFSTRPTEFSHTELGETGSQHTDIVTTEFGHFWSDAKRGAIFQLHPNAKGLTQISAFKRDGQPSGMRQWFKKHLPFKILKNKEVEGLTEQSEILDNKYMSLGMNMWWDSKFKRLFVTKRDKTIEDPCVKYSDEIGFYIDETECNGADPIISCPLGYEYNEETQMCEKAYSTNPCPTGWEFNQATGTCQRILETNAFEEEEIIETITCSEGFTYNEATGMCEMETIEPPQCPDGYAYNEDTKLCEIDYCVSDIVLVLDASSSMDTTEFMTMQEFFTDLVDELTPQINNGVIRIGVIRFSTTVSHIQLPFSSSPVTIKNVIYQGQEGGGTNIAQGLCEAKNMITNYGNPNAKPQVILYTDGTQSVFPTGGTCSMDTSSHQAVFDMRDQIEAIGGDLLMVISGDETERELVKNGYLNPATSSYGSQAPLASTGSGLFGSKAWDAEFDQLPTILEDLLLGLECEVTVAPSCPTGCSLKNGECVCFEEVPPTIEQEVIIHYSCLEGWIYNEENNTCSFTETQEACSSSCELVEDYCQCTEQVDPIIDTIKTPVDINTFKDVSWTLAYNPIEDNWISYYSFTPDYAISFNDYFQTGHNNEEDKKGIWSHLLTNKSYQVFYGKKYPWIIETPFKNEYMSKVLEAVNVSAETFRYHNEYDYAFRRKDNFNSAVIYNSSNNSGILNLNYSDIADDYKYPIQTNNVTQEIKATHHKGTIRFNYFFNRVADENNNMPVWNWDDNEILKTLNPMSLTYTKKNPLERMRGDMFLLRLQQDKSSQYKQMFKWSIGKEHIDTF